MILKAENGNVLECSVEVKKVDEQTLVLYIENTDAKMIVDSFRRKLIEPIEGYEEYTVFSGAVISENDGVVELKKQFG